MTSSFCVETDYLRGGAHVCVLSSHLKQTEQNASSQSLMLKVNEVMESSAEGEDVLLPPDADFSMG